MGEGKGGLRGGKLDSKEDCDIITQARSRGSGRKHSGNPQDPQHDGGAVAEEGWLWQKAIQIYKNGLIVSRILKQIKCGTFLLQTSIRQGAYRMTPDPTQSIRVHH